MDQTSVPSEKQTNFPKCDHCGNVCCHHNHHNPLWRLLKLLVFIVVVFVVFVVGVAAGRHSAGITGIRWGSNMVQFDTDRSQRGGNMMYSQDAATVPAPAVPSQVGMMGYGRFAASNRVAGVITGINGTEITLVDNGGAKQTVYSSSNTIVTAASGEISATALKAKQFIVCFVSVTDGKKVAQVIQLTQ